MDESYNLRVGVISDGKYGERAFENIKNRFKAFWIEVPDIPLNVILDDDVEMSIPDCDLYLSYVRHPDIITQLAELQKPLILGVLPGYGLYEQTKRVNSRVIHAPDLLLLVSIPLLVGFVIVVVYNVFITKIFKMRYKEAVITVIIGSSSHFEIAIATAIAMYGIGSVAALGTTMGLFWEVPVMLSIVYLGKYLSKRGFWKSESNSK